MVHNGQYVFMILSHGKLDFEVVQKKLLESICQDSVSKSLLSLIPFNQIAVSEELIAQFHRVIRYGQDGEGDCFTYFALKSFDNSQPLL